MDYAWRYKAVLRVLRGGKKKTIAELAQTVGDSKEKVGETVRRMRKANHATFEKGKLDKKNQGLVSLTSSGEEKAKSLRESELLKIAEKNKEPEHPQSMKLGGIWPDELERSKKRVQVGDSFQAIYYKTDYQDNPKGGRAIKVTTKKTKIIHVVSKHSHLVRTSDGSSSTYAEIAMAYRGEPLDRRD